MKDTDLLNARLTKVQLDYDQQLLNCDQLATENTQKAAELKAKEDEINGLKQDTVRLTKMREAIQRKLRTIEDQKIEVEQQKETLKGQIAGLEKGKWRINLGYPLWGCSLLFQFNSCLFYRKMY